MALLGWLATLILLIVAVMRLAHIPERECRPVFVVVPEEIFS